MKKTSKQYISGAKIVVQALFDQGIEYIFGYPGGAVLPIFDEIYQQDKLKHILVRHEQAAGHAAEGYARSTGKIGAILVTSGPGVTNIITPLQNALMDSVPIICICGQVPTTLIGSGAFQEADTISITKSCTKKNWLVKDVDDLCYIIHEACYVAKTGRPGPVLIDIPKDIQSKKGPYVFSPTIAKQCFIDPNLDIKIVEKVIRFLLLSEKPVIYSGGGIINSGLEAVKLLREFVNSGNFPITSTLMGLGAYPATSQNWLGMLGMHGTYEANMAMHHADMILAIGARFDDRITGRLDKFSPNAKIIHIDIDITSLNKNVPADIAIVSDAGNFLKIILNQLKKYHIQDQKKIDIWWSKIEEWRSKKSLFYKKRDDVIMPQYAIERLYVLTKGYNPYLTTEVGQHQMWTAQYFKFNEPNHFMTSGGLGTMGYGLPSSIGVQIAKPKDLVICVAGDASIQMNIQELATAIQYNIPIKVFILNNHYMGMVRQWQQLLYGNRLSHSYTSSLPNFAKLAESYGAIGIECNKPENLDENIDKMISCKRTVVFDCKIVNLENCLPMIPSGCAHNEMLLADSE